MKPVELFLEPHQELLAPSESVPARLEKVRGLLPLTHQLETYRQLKENHIVFNSFPTGTGKTLATYLHLLDRPDSNALIIAPTNALIAQHAQDLRDFKEQSSIPHLILEVDAAKLRALSTEGERDRNPDILFRLLQNPFEFAEQLDLPEDLKAEHPPLVFITNPDIFYYALYGLVNRFDRRNLLQTIFKEFGYIVVDEFHYYDARQFSVFLFFVTLSHSMKFFEQKERRMAVLTATPNENILTYFERLAGQGLGYSLVSPNNDYPKGDAVTSLAPMQVTLYPYASRQSVDLPEHIDSAQLRNWIAEGKTGAFISDRLTDISVLSQRLKGAFDLEKVTGAVPKEDRPSILTKPLLLATPTVDIGYNFKREDKNRQNIDFLVFIAEYEDEFWQRLGRAGRVLGKEVTTTPSQVSAFLPEDAVERLQPFDKQTLTHEQLKTIFEETGALPKKPFDGSYIASDGVAATFSSFATIRDSLTDDHIHLIEDALQLIQKIFAPKYAPKTVGQIIGYASERRELERLLSEPEAQPKPVLFNQFRAYVGDVSISPDEARALFRHYLEAKNIIFRAEHSFRGSGDEIQVQVYDPRRFLTNDATTTHYNLMHLLRYFHLQVYESAKDFQRESGQLPADNLLYVRLDDLLPKDERPLVGFSLETRENPVTFEHRHLRKLWAFKNIRILLNGGATYLDNRAQEVFKTTPLPMTIFLEEDNSYLRRYLKDLKVYPRELQVCFVESGETREYLAVVGVLGKQLVKKLEQVRRWNKHISSYTIV